MSEGLQVQAEVAPVGALVKPLRQLGRAGSGQVVRALLLGQFNQRCGSGTAIEVIVQQHLGSGRQRLGCRRRRVQAAGAVHKQRTVELRGGPDAAGQCHVAG